MSETTTTDLEPAGRIDRLFRRAIKAVLDEQGDLDPVIRPAQNPEFGDYQCNAAMSLAKSRGLQPLYTAPSEDKVTMNEVKQRVQKLVGCNGDRISH